MSSFFIVSLISLACSSTVCVLLIMDYNQRKKISKDLIALYKVLLSDIEKIKSLQK